MPLNKPQVPCSPPPPLPRVPSKYLFTHRNVLKAVTLTTRHFWADTYFGYLKYVNHVTSCDQQTYKTLPQFSLKAMAFMKCFSRHVESVLKLSDLLDVKLPLKSLFSEVLSRHQILSLPSRIHCFQIFTVFKEKEREKLDLLALNLFT